MVDPEYIAILREISDWHIVPNSRHTPIFHQKLKRLLGNTPYHIGAGGDVFIGAGSPAAVPGSGVCLRSELTGCGGVLNVGQDNKYFFSRVSGYHLPNRLLGRKFGVYSELGGKSICELEVEGVHTEADGPVLYFIAGEADLQKVKNAGAVVVSHPAAFDVVGRLLSGWNLSSLINSAFIIYFLKTHSPDDGFYGCLSLKKLVQGGAAEGAANRRLVNFGVFDDERFKQDFGYRTDLAGFAGGAASLEQDVGKLSLPAADKSLWAHLRVENTANASAVGRFEAEAVPVARLEGYLKFSAALIEASKALRPGPVQDVMASEVVRAVNEASGMAAIIGDSGDFVEFLNYGMPKISDVYKKHGLLFSTAKISAYEALRKSLAAKSFDVDADTEKLTAWGYECAEAVYKVIPGAAARPNQIKIVTLLMSPVPAISSKGRGINIFLSLDKIGSADLKKILYGELSFRIASHMLGDLCLPPRLAEYYSEGLRYALPAKTLGLNLEETLGLPKQKHEDYRKNIDKLREFMRYSLSDDMCYLYEGKYHKYFKKRALPEPYRPGEGLFSGYGNFLAGVEVLDLLESGKFNEKILSF